jgi:hypothetical protein
MGINWAATSTRWTPHIHKDGTRDELEHLDWFTFEIHFDAFRGQPARTVTVVAGFSFHTFTCDLKDAGPDPELYTDGREVRAWSQERYEWSFRLPAIARELDRRKCYFSGRGNYFTLDLEGLAPGEQYRAYFDVRRKDANAVDLVVQSAYVVKKDEIPKGRRDKTVRFRVIVSEALRGKKPKQPPR